MATAQAPTLVRTTFLRAAPRCRWPEVRSLARWKCGANSAELTARAATPTAPARYVGSHTHTECRFCRGAAALRGGLLESPRGPAYKGWNQPDQEQGDRRQREGTRPGLSGCFCPRQPYVLDLDESVGEADPPENTNPNNNEEEPPPRRLRPRGGIAVHDGVLPEDPPRMPGLPSSSRSRGVSCR